MASRTSSPLADPLTGERSALRTRKALLVLDVQNDLLRPTCKLQVQSHPDLGIRIEKIVSAFRHTGQVIWVRSEFQDGQVSNPEVSTAGGSAVFVTGNGHSLEEEQEDDSDAENEAMLKAALSKMRESSSRPSTKRTTELLERMSLSSKAAAAKIARAPLDLFMSREPNDLNLCQRGTAGAEFIPSMRDVIDFSQDAVFLKSSYSAFMNTDLLSHLRSRLITEIYLCGRYTNVTVYATARVVASHGLRVTLIQDCLAFCKEEAHEAAILNMVKDIGAGTIMSQDLVDQIGEKMPQNKPSGDRRRPVPEPRPSSMQFSLASSRKPDVKNTGKRAQCRGVANNTTTLGVNDKVGEGDSMIIHAQQSTVLTPHEDQIAGGSAAEFAALKNEIYWQKMYHATGEVPRLVCAQGEFESDGSMPVYRHPSDTFLPLLHYSVLVQRLRIRAELLVGHCLNHCLIQLYRGGGDFISEHSDKTLDITRGTSIVNVSLGAQRIMRLRTKKHGKDDGMPRTTQLIPLPHGSMFVLGQKTNAAWLHGINYDRRPPKEKTDEETAFGGQRISLTFRCVGTFMTPDCRLIYGQGATAKSRDNARSIMKSDLNRRKALIHAFGTENQSTIFEWDRTYGHGFDNLDLSSFDIGGAPTLFLSGDWLEDFCVRLCLEVAGVRYEVGGVAKAEAGPGYHPKVCLRDVNDHRTEVTGMLSAAQYIYRFHWKQRDGLQAKYEAGYVEMLHWIQQVTSIQRASNLDKLALLEVYSQYRSDESVILSSLLRITDCIIWPMAEQLDDKGLLDGERWPKAAEYHQALSQNPLIHMILLREATVSGA